MLSNLTRAVFLLLLSLVLSACGTDRTREILPTRVEADLNRGRELFNGLAACGFCHGQKIEPGSLPTGGRQVYDIHGAVVASNLTPAKSGLHDWKSDNLVNLIRQGVDRQGRAISPEVHRGYEWMSDKDLISIIAYLSSMPAIEKQHERREVSFVDRNTTGLLEQSRTVSGYVPAVDPRHSLAYGRYLVDHVARCSVCHSSPSSYFISEEYFAGGKTIRFSEGEKIAPALRGSGPEGIAPWGSKDIVNYLRTGVTPDNNRSDNRFCPVGFFARASDADLIAIASYLKSGSN